MLIVRMSSSVGLKKLPCGWTGEFRLECFLVGRWSCIIMKRIVYEISLRKATRLMVIVRV